MTKRVNLWKDKQICYDVPLRDIQEIDPVDDIPLKLGERECSIVALKYGTPHGRWFTVYNYDLGRLFPRRWRPA